MSKLLVVAVSNDAAQQIIDSLHLRGDKIQVITSQGYSRSLETEGLQIGAEFVSDGSSFSTRFIQGKPLTPCKDITKYTEKDEEVDVNSIDEDIRRISDVVTIIADNEWKEMQNEVDTKKGLFSESTPEHPLLSALNNMFDVINKGELTSENIMHTAAYLILYAKYKEYPLPSIKLKGVAKSQ